MEEERKIDRRVKRTEKAIQSAFVDLLKKKDFEAITVNDIVNETDLSRGTFYLHYTDKYDLLEKMQKDFLDSISENLAALCSQSNKKNTYKTAEDALRDYLLWLVTMYQNNAELMLLFLRMDGEFSFLNKIRKLTEYNLQNGLYPWLDINSAPIPEKYITTFLFSGDMYAVIEWLESGCVESPDEFVNYLIYINKTGVFSLLTDSKGNT